MTVTVTENQDDLSKTLSAVVNTQKICETLMKTPHYQRMGQEGIFAIVAKARSLRIDPLDALNGGLYFVQGKVGMSTEMMASLIRQSGHSVTKDPKSNNTMCILHGKRSDSGDKWTVSFSLEDAKRAGLLKNMYEKYPGIMLYNRAMSMLARQLFPDVIKGAGYTYDELKEIAKNKESDFECETIPNEIEVKEAGYQEFNLEMQENSRIKYLTEILDRVPDYKAKVDANLATQGKTYADLTDEMYDKVYTAALEKSKAMEIENVN